MFKQYKLGTKIFAGIISAIFLFTLTMIIISGNQVPKNAHMQYINDNASADNKVEALKTMTANLMAMQSKNKQLSDSVAQLQIKNHSALEQLKNSVSQEVKSALGQLKQQNTMTQNVQWKNAPPNYPINKSQAHSFVWISDMAPEVSHSNNIAHVKLKKTNKPRYTIPVNATLTGASLMTPLIGRIPIDGKLPSPYHFKLVLSPQNLTANGYPLPNIKGAVMSGVARGDMLASCARGKIYSITFIFNDGRISTTQANSDDKALGYLSDDFGNPCLEGTFHSNAALFLGATATLSGLAGYAKGISDLQYMRNTTSDGNSISTLIGSANRTGIGQGIASAAEASQTWWNRRVNNSFDYVFVANIDPATGKPRTVSININQEIPIDYNPKARKVDYETISSHNQRTID